MGRLKSFKRALLDAWKESLHPQGARGLYLGSGLELELQLNTYMVCELFVQILASGLGLLAVVWATAVLLGGFSASLEGADFWVITAIVFIQTGRFVGLNESRKAQFFNQVPRAMFELGVEKRRRKPSSGEATSMTSGYRVLWGLRAQDLVGTSAFLSMLVLAVPRIAGLGCISLSIYRLVALLSIHHDNPNVFRALMLFYALVLLQGGLFITWWSLLTFRLQIAHALILKYGLEDRRKLVRKYMDKTLSTALKNGVSSTINRNLASFAADMINSDHSQDRIEAVLMIHTLTSQEELRTSTLSQIQSSPLFVSRLLDMVTSKSRTDQRTKICIAEIVAHLAGDLRLADISGATESISSMIDTYSMKISSPATHVNINHHTSIEITIDQQETLQSANTTNGAENIGHRISVKQSVKRGLARMGKRREKIITNIINTSGVDNIINDQQGSLRSSSTTRGASSTGAESKPLIIHGLLILAKLAVNPDNGKQIYEFKDLFSKIILPVKNKVYEIPSDDGITMEITEKALEVVSKLVSGTDETNGKMRQDICSNGKVVKDIRGILERDHTYNQLKVPATKILTELYVDISTRDTIGHDDIADFIKVLVNIFLDAANESGLRKTAGKSLAVLAMDNANCTTIMNFSTGTETSVVQQLTAMISEANNRLYQTAIAQLLARFFANSASNAERKGLESVKTILHEVLKVICYVEQAITANQVGSPEHILGQQQAQDAAQTGQHNPGRLLSQTCHCLNSLLRAHRSHTANRNTPIDNLPANAQIVGARRKSLAAFLGLGLQICHQTEITADDFDTALGRIPLSMGEFVDKLNYIIEQCKDHSGDSMEGKRPLVDYLIIIKTVTKLCTWMMQSKPDCITEFQNKNTSTKLQGALEDMRDLELGMILTDSAGDMTNYETLSTIVAAARQKMDANVLGRSG